MITGKLLSYGSDLNEVFAIRKRVFVEELGISEQNEFDDIDYEAIHVLVYETLAKENDISDNRNGNKKPVATGRIEFDGNKCIISHVCVLREYRNKEYGDFTVKMLLNKAFTSGIPEVIVDSFSENAGFFKKIGFSNIDTNKDENKSTTKRMKIRANDIVKTCNSCHN